MTDEVWPTTSELLDHLQQEMTHQTEWGLSGDPNKTRFLWILDALIHVTRNLAELETRLEEQEAEIAKTGFEGD